MTASKPFAASADFPKMDAKHYHPNVTNLTKSVTFALFSLIMQYIFFFFLVPGSGMFDGVEDWNIGDIALDVFLSMIFCTLLSEAAIWINNYLNTRISWMKQPVRRLLVETSANIVSVHAIILLQILIMVPFDDGQVSSPDDETMLLEMQWVVISVVIALMISAIQTGDYLITNWKSSILDAAEHRLTAFEHKQMALEAELQASRLQLDPHFVFNNLSVLSELILEDQHLGHEYAENLAKVYRYLLANSRTDLISLKEEIRFVKAYLFLLENRIGQGLCFEIDINDDVLSRKLPPLTLQLLIENAIKHNKMLKDTPLSICIRSTDYGQLAVSNNLNPLENKAESSGIGLQNIFNRYRLLSDQMPFLFEKSGWFTVYIPLLY